MSLEQSITEYNEKRRELIADDRSLRLDSQRKYSATELEADRIVRSIRAQEAETVWSADYPDIPHPFPGMEFLTAKDIIVKTKLFKILTRMPKGALLHAHLDATVNAEFLYSKALEHKEMYVRTPEIVTAETIGTILPQFLSIPKGIEVAFSSVTVSDKAYQPDTWVTLRQARREFSHDLGGSEGFDRWVIGSMTINPTEAYKTHNTVTKIWQKFSSTFRVAFGLVRCDKIFESYIREFLYTSIEDGVSYVEPRVNFYFDPTSDEVSFGFWTKALKPFGYGSNRDIVALFDRVVSEVKEDMAKKGRQDEFVGAKIIYSSLRFASPEIIQVHMEDCIELKKEFPHVIAGFDLVGDENVLHPLMYYQEKLLWFQTRQKEAGVDIPFILHAGETLGDGTEADMNLYDAILLGTKRIGHGFSLVKHPKLMEICREKNIALEVCPISNEILRLTSSMPMHPLPILLNHGVPVALCSDDPSVFGNMGLSFDHFQVIAASEVTGLLQLAAISRGSFGHSMLDADDKVLAEAAWQRRWEKFVQQIIEDGDKI